MRIPVLRALSQRNFALLWTGQTISLFGDGMYNVALAWQALQLDGGAKGLGLVLLIRGVARTATLLVGGALADRYPKRLLMLFGESVQLVSITVLTFLVASDAIELWHLTVVAATTGLGGGIFLSSSAAIPELVPEEHYQSANSLRSMSLLLAHEMLGPAVGGVLVAVFGTAIAFAIDAATFLVSIGALVVMRWPSRPRADERTTLFRDVREGFGYVRRTPWLWVSLLAVGTIGNFAAFSMLPVFIPLIVQDRLSAGADVLGLVMAGYGAGGVLGALIAGSRTLKLTSVKPAYLMWAVACLGLAVIAVAPSAWAAAAGFALTGITGQVAEVIWVTIQQTYVPGRLLGRVIATDWLISLSLQPLGVALAAPLAARFGPGPALLGGVLVCLMAIGFALLNKQVRHLEKPAEAPALVTPTVQRSER